MKGGITQMKTLQTKPEVDESPGEQPSSDRQKGATPQGLYITVQVVFIGILTWHGMPPKEGGSIRLKLMRC